MTDAAAEAIRAAWKSAIAEVENFPDDPDDLIEQRGRLRNALMEIRDMLDATLQVPGTYREALILDIERARDAAREALHSNLSG